MKLTDGLALWGRITGTVAIVLQLVGYFRERSRLRIKFLHGFVQMIAGKGQAGSDTYSRIIITNLGREPISITGAYFATVKEGDLGLFALADGFLSSPRVLNPENPRTEFMN